MNREETAEAREIMKWFEDGNEVEYKGDGDSARVGDWLRAGSPCWDWLNTEYRKKPKLKEVWMVDEMGKDAAIFNDSISANSYATLLDSRTVPFEVTHYRQVEE